MRFIPVQEQLAIAAASADAAQSFAQGGRAWRRGISEADGVAMRAVTRVVVELARHIAAQALALAHAGQLCGQLAHEAFGFVDDLRDCRHGWFLAVVTDNFVGDSLARPLFGRYRLDQQLWTGRRIHRNGTEWQGGMIRAETSGRPRVSADATATLRTCLPLPRRTPVGSGSSGPRWPKNRLIPRA
jgi:hypothetical protein